MSRLDDLLFAGVPLLANPSDEDLYIRDEYGRRGRPHGHFKKWHLNNLGFRGADIELAAPSNCTRLVALGASETFGLYESPNREYPAALAQRLSADRCVEVVNAGIPGRTLRTMITYWQHWVAQFKPEIVLIYASPHFYLGEQKPPPAVSAPATVPVAPPAAAANTAAGWRFQSRFVSRLRDVIDTPAPIQMLRDMRTIGSQLDAHEADWEFSTVPAVRLEQLRTDLTELVEAVIASGARPILLTHAQRATLPLRKDDIPDLWAARIFAPQARPEVIVAFNREANGVIASVGRSLGIQTIDTSAALEGCRECFGDLVHFTDLGSGRFADAIVRELNLTKVESDNHSAIQ